MLVESFFACFWPFQFLTQTDHFAKSIAFARWPIFKSSHFWNVLCFYERFFAQNNSNVLGESFFGCFLAILIFDLNHFAKSIAFARWPIIKMLSFLEYLVIL